MFILLTILIIVLETIYLLSFYKLFHSSRMRVINEGALILFFSIGYMHFGLTYSIRMESIVFMLITALLLTSLTLVLVGVFEYQFGLLLFSIINALIYIGSSIKMNTTGVPVMWADFNSGLFLGCCMEHVLETKLSLYYFIIRYWGITVLLYVQEENLCINHSNTDEADTYRWHRISGNFSIDWKSFCDHSSFQKP